MKIKRLKRLSFIVLFILIGGPSILFSLRDILIRSNLNTIISYPCACVTSEMIIKNNIRQIKIILENELMKSRKYPTFEQLEGLIQKSKNIWSEYTFAKYEKELELHGNTIVYKQVYNGQAYYLKGYATGKLFGKAVISDVDSKSFVKFDIL